TMIFAKELMAQGWVKPARDFNSFRPQLSRIPADEMPEDKKFNPLSINPYVMFRAVSQAGNYSQPELVRAMGLLLECNQKLVSRSLDESLVLQHALVQIVNRTP
ncbi:MAG: DNA polymerase III subunit delta, partial [Limisphaerales bacterium]